MYRTVVSDSEISPIGLDQRKQMKYSDKKAILDIV